MAVKSLSLIQQPIAIAHIPSCTLPIEPMGHQFPNCHNNVPQNRWLRTKEMYCLTVLEVRSLKLGCGQGHVPPKGAKERYVQVPLLIFQVARTKYSNRNSINKFLTILQAGEPKSWVLQIWYLLRDPYFRDGAFLHAFMWYKGLGSFSNLFCKSINSSRLKYTS